MVRVDETLVYICADGLKGSLLCSVEHAQSGTAGSGKMTSAPASASASASSLAVVGIGKGAYIFDNYLHIRVGSLGAGHIPATKIFWDGLSTPTTMPILLVFIV